MKAYKIDIPVLLIFWARPTQFQKVFEQVKMARPSKLYLYQDGPRENSNDDYDKIIECRNIAEDIDWDCKVYKMYQENNIGCDPSEYIAQKWMFENEEMGIILEDDDVPSQSFFPFCKEMLERYKDDFRIGYIAGMNHLGQYSNNTDDSYFFSSSGSIWGWATWKRTANLWDEQLKFLSDENVLQLLKRIMGKNFYTFKLKTWKRHKQSGVVYYESLVNSAVLLNSQINIFPSKNLISNIGISENATHAKSILDKMSKQTRNLFFMDVFDLEFPLKHPEYVINDLNYRNTVLDMLGRRDSNFIKTIKRILSKIIK